MPELEIPESTMRADAGEPMEGQPAGEETTQASIAKHLKGLATNQGRIEYLQQVLAHRGLLSVETREGVLEVMDGLFRAEKMFEEGARIFEQLGELDRAARSYQEAADFRSSIHQDDYSRALLLTKEEDFSEAAAIYEENGWHQMAMEMWNRAGDYHRAEAAGLRAAEKEERGGMQMCAAALYVRAGHP